MEMILNKISKLKCPLILYMCWILFWILNRVNSQPLIPWLWMRMSLEKFMKMIFSKNQMFFLKKELYLMGCLKKLFSLKKRKNRNLSPLIDKLIIIKVNLKSHLSFIFVFLGLKLNLKNPYSNLLLIFSLVPFDLFRLKNLSLKDLILFLQLYFVSKSKVLYY